MWLCFCPFHLSLLQSWHAFASLLWFFCGQGTQPSDPVAWQQHCQLLLFFCSQEISTLSSLVMQASFLVLFDFFWLRTLIFSSWVMASLFLDDRSLSLAFSFSVMRDLASAFLFASFSLLLSAAIFLSSATSANSLFSFVFLPSGPAACEEFKWVASPKQAATAKKCQVSMINEKERKSTKKKKTRGNKMTVHATCDQNTQIATNLCSAGNWWQFHPMLTSELPTFEKNTEFSSKESNSILNTWQVTVMSNSGLPDNLIVFWIGGSFCFLLLLFWKVAHTCAVFCAFWLKTMCH